MVAPECLLQVTHLTGTGKRLYCLDAAILYLHSKHQTGTHRFAINEYGAGTTNAMFTAYVNTRHTQLMAKKVTQKKAWLNVARTRLTIEFKAYRYTLCFFRLHLNTLL
jgi:hypothetical protein